MTRLFRITPRAQEDLKQIGRYTFSQWGEKQRNNDLRNLDKRFFWLAENPQLGKQRPDIKQGYYCYQQGSHLIFYLISKTSIDIIGIPHKAMDVLGYFEE
ncbi:MAG: type II toxin-antitoxin system RelE/ParE family toxin [Methylococcales bacterium]|nr:type II toxin-antitoxin system RelE/ParE family toxin [Methylococcales bacterium]